MKQSSIVGKLQSATQVALETLTWQDTTYQTAYEALLIERHLPNVLNDAIECGTVSGTVIAYP